MDGSPTDVTGKGLGAHLAAVETPGINLCRDTNGLFLLAWALRVTGPEDKAERNRLWGGKEEGEREKHREC